VIAGLLALTVIAVSAAALVLHDAANAARQHANACAPDLAWPIQPSRRVDSAGALAPLSDAGWDGSDGVAGRAAGW
jgi:hypothetical protein